MKPGLHSQTSFLSTAGSMSKHVESKSSEGPVGLGFRGLGFRGCSVCGRTDEQKVVVRPGCAGVLQGTHVSWASKQLCGQHLSTINSKPG